MRVCGRLAKDTKALDDCSPCVPEKDLYSYWYLYKNLYHNLYYNFYAYGVKIVVDRDCEYREIRKKNTGPTPSHMGILLGVGKILESFPNSCMALFEHHTRDREPHP